MAARVVACKSNERGTAMARRSCIFWKYGFPGVISSFAILARRVPRKSAE